MPQFTSGHVRTQLSQQQRLGAAVIYFGALLELDQYLTDSVWPPYGIDGLWFYSAAAALLLGEFVLEPFFTRPADALASALAILIAAGTVSLDDADISVNAAKWGRIGVICAAGAIIGLAVISIAFKDATGKRKRWRKSLRVPSPASGARAGSSARCSCSPDMPRSPTRVAGSQRSLEHGS